MRADDHAIGGCVADAVDGGFLPAKVWWLWHELACFGAWWAAQTLMAAAIDGGADEQVALLRGALAEAPELSVSGGAVELQLDLIATQQRAPKDFG